MFPISCVSFTSIYVSRSAFVLLWYFPPDLQPQGASCPYVTCVCWSLPSLPFLSRRHQSDGNEIAHTRLRASTRDLRASPKPASKSTIEEDLKKLIDLESPTPESQKNFKVHARQSPARSGGQTGWSCSPQRCPPAPGGVGSGLLPPPAPQS